MLCGKYRYLLLVMLMFVLILSSCTLFRVTGTVIVESEAYLDRPSDNDYKIDLTDEFGSTATINLSDIFQVEKREFVWDFKSTNQIKFEYVSKIEVTNTASVGQTPVWSIVEYKTSFTESLDPNHFLEISIYSKQEDRKDFSNTMIYTSDDFFTELARNNIKSYTIKYHLSKD